MKLQVSFDMLDLDKAITAAHQIQAYIDIIEIGSLVMYQHGTIAITRFREQFPEKTILADLKIVDRAKEATQLALDAGADWITVLAGTSRGVIHAACNSAHDMGKKVMLDLIDASSRGQSALEAQSLGVDALLFHRPSDESAQAISLEQWDIVKGNTKLPVFIATQVTRDNMHQLTQLNPAGLVMSMHSIDSAFIEEVEFVSSMINHD